MMHNEVNCSTEDLLRQAHKTANVYFHHSVDYIDNHFGNEYARKHPELIAAFMQTAALDFLAAQVNLAGQYIQEGLEIVGHKIEMNAPGP